MTMYIYNIYLYMYIHLLLSDVEYIAIMLLIFFTTSTLIRIMVSHSQNYLPLLSLKKIPEYNHPKRFLTTQFFLKKNVKHPSSQRQPPRAVKFSRSYGCVTMWVLMPLGVFFGGFLLVKTNGFWMQGFGTQTIFDLYVCNIDTFTYILCILWTIYVYLLYVCVNI